MRDIFLFILGAFAGKLIDDNLPNMHYSNLYKIYQYRIEPAIVLGYIGFLAIIVKITKNQQQQKQINIALLAVAVAYIGVKAYTLHTKNIKNTSTVS